MGDEMTFVNRWQSGWEDWFHRWMFYDVAHQNKFTSYVGCHVCCYVWSFCSLLVRAAHICSHVIACDFICSFNHCMSQPSIQKNLISRSRQQKISAIYIRPPILSWARIVLRGQDSSSPFRALRNHYIERVSVTGPNRIYNVCGISKIHVQTVILSIIRYALFKNWRDPDRNINSNAYITYLVRIGNRGRWRVSDEKWTQVPEQ